MNMLTSLKKMVDAVVNDPKKILLVILTLIKVGVIAGNYLLNESDPVLQLTEIESMSPKFSNYTLEARTSIKVGFSVPDLITVYPEMGTFVLTAAKLNGSGGLHAFCESIYKISKHHEIILLNFKTQVPDEPARDLQKMLWIRVVGDFKMTVKLIALPGFPKSHRHVHFLCEVALEAIPDMIVFKTCDTSKEAFN